MPSRGQTASKSQAGSRSKTQLSKRQGDGSVHKDTRHGARQNQPQTAATRQGSRQNQSLVTDTRQGTRQNQPLTAASRRQHESRADRRNETASKSLFTKDGKGKSAAAGEKVTTDNVWNKFLDDKDVVRAPTAESRESRDPEQSQFSSTRDSEISGSQGSSEEDDEDEEAEEEEIDDSDDDRTIYSNYYLDHDYYEPEGTPGPRAVIEDATYEACSCFPNRSDKLRGSMLYDKIKCKHTGLIGHTHPGVFKFNPYWNENMEIPKRLRKRDMQYPKTTFLFGYPKPRFELISESETDDDVSSMETTERREPSRKKTRGHSDDDDDDDSDDDDYSDDDDSYDSDDDNYDENYDDSEMETEDEDEDEDNDYIPFQLPQIGIPKTPSLPPSSQGARSRYSDYSESVPDSLPELPGTRQLTALSTARSGQRAVTTRQGTTAKTHRTAKTRRTDKATKLRDRDTRSLTESDEYSELTEHGKSRRRTASRQSLPTGPVISTVRTFQGKCYDPVTKQVMLYDIGTKPGKRLPVGIIEPLYKPPTVLPSEEKSKTAEKENRAESKPGSNGSNRNNISPKSNGGILKAAVLGNVFISSMLKSKNKKDTA